MSSWKLLGGCSDTVNDSVEAYNKFLFAQVLKLQLQKMFANCFHTRIKPGSPLTTPTKPSSQNTKLNRTNDKLQPSMSMPWRIIRLTMQLSRTRMWLLSVCNGRNSNNNSANNNKQGLTTVAIAPEVKTTTEATTTDNLRNPKAPMRPETVNSVSTEKSWITHKKNAEKELMINQPCVNGKGQLYWLKINNIDTNNAQSANNDSNKEVDSVFQSRASSPPSWMLQVSFHNWF